MIIAFFLSAAEKVLNRYLQLDPETRQRLGAMEGRVVAMQSPSLSYAIYLKFTAEKICLLKHYAGTVDVTLQGAPFDFMRLSLLGSDSAALFASDIKVSGDMDVAEQFRNVFADLSIDWEEHLSKVTGDVIAHQIGNLVRALCDWARQSTTNLQQDITEYLQEEKKLLPTRFELEDFFVEVDVLRNDVDRLQVKLNKLIP